ncbi:MAG: LysM peptidoglycan-binding domain-containing protein [Candidatus Hydrogenedens sp.]|jgi:LysM repeat protein|nr:LysM peptidoglycan-binding domain-containing protein [Candidatus Hydrogenedens sp.]
MTTALLLCLALSGTFDLSLAPDQPLAFIYVDDPLILELSSQKDAKVEGRLLFRASVDNRETESSLEPIFIHGGTEYWYAVHSAPEERGLCFLEADLIVNGEPQRFEKRYCRIDRPAALTALPIVAYCKGDENSCPVAAMRNVGVNTILADAKNKALPAIAAKAAAEEAHLFLTVDAAEMAQTLETIKAVLQNHCEDIFRFEVICERGRVECAKYTDILRETGCPADISLVVDDAASFAAVMGQCTGYPLRHVTLTSDEWPRSTDAQRIRQMAVQQGLEGLSVHMACPNWQATSQQSYAEFLRLFFHYKAAGVGTLGIDASLIADEEGTLEMMAWLNGLALRFQGGNYVGTLSGEGDKSIMLFRTGASWLAVIFGSDKKTDDLSLPVDGALNLELSDALGNPLEVPEIKEGKLTLHAGAIPLYLTGDGGVLLGDAALQRVARLSKDFLGRKEMADALPPELMQLIKTIGAEPKGSGCRLRFMELLRYLPALEEHLCFSTLPKQTAIPALMMIIDLARSLAVIEEDRAELFVEPLADTMSKTEELQSLYLTASSGSSRTRERGDWILSEVRKLLEEAETLEKTGRKIEATAVAQIAYWRAQCLKPASQAEAGLDAEPLEPLVLPGDIPVETDTPPIPVEVLSVVPDEKAKDSDDEESAGEEKSGADVKEPEKEASEKRNAAGDIEYVVKSGDNPYLIAKRHKVKLDDLLKWNKLTKRSTLRIGQKLIIKKK